ncbi:MAG: hypothetical protein IKP73_05835 [Bacteroidales bacterium]|nr:hypothetical protein [Bacteroidales bacterium]
MKKVSTDFEVLDFSELENIIAGKDNAASGVGTGKFGIVCKCSPGEGNAGKGGFFCGCKKGNKSNKKGK